MRLRTICIGIAVIGVLSGLSASIADASSGRRSPVAVGGAATSQPEPSPAGALPAGAPTSSPIGVQASIPLATAGPVSAPTTPGRPPATQAAINPAVRPAAAPSHASPPATSGSAPASGPAPAVPGTYRYRQTSSPAVAAAEGTLVVSPATSGPQGVTQAWTKNLGGTVKASTTVMVFTGSGMFMVSPSGQLAGTPGSCSFATPVQWPPWPETIGRSFSGQATCAGPVHTMTITGQIDRVEALSLDGAMVDTFRLVSTLTMTGTYNGSALAVTQTETNWYAPSVRVPVKTQTHVQGTVIGLPVTIDSTGVLESARPA